MKDPTVAKRKREEEEEASMVDIFTGLSKVSEKNLKQSIATIKNQRANGKSTKKSMNKLLHSSYVDMEAKEDDATLSDSDDDDDDDMVVEDEEEEEEENFQDLLHSKEEKKARRYRSDDLTKEEDVEYVDEQNPNQQVSEEFGDFTTIMSFGCMKAFKTDYAKDLKYRAEEAKKPDPRDIKDWRFIQQWVGKNIRDPLDRLIISLKGHEDRTAYFKQLMSAASLEFHDADQTRTHVCILSGKELPAIEIVQVALVDDPRLFQPLNPKSKQPYNPKPHLFTIDTRYRHITYSVFYLHTFLDSMGIECLRWARKNKLLHGTSVIDIVTEFVDTHLDMAKEELRCFKVCKKSVEAYQRGQQ